MKKSVCMATYNGALHIKDQIASILPQLGALDELIISDDNSADETVDIIKTYGDPRIVIYNNQFRNPIFNFEFALNRCTGDLIFLADQDDLWDLNKIKIVSSLLETYDLVVTDCQIIDKHGSLLHDSFFDIRHSGKGLIKNFLKNSYLGCCMAMKRQIVQKALPFPRWIPMHDMWLGMIGEIFGTTFFCNQKLVRYRRHGKNKTYTAEKSQNSFLKKMILRCQLGACLILRYVALRGAK